MHPHIQPIVLVGGRSRRFGRDKLREPMRDDDKKWLVDRPIAVLREVFGGRIALVGECHADVAARGDLIIPDCHPGAGPIGGILSALDAVPHAIFVLSGDLPAMTARSIRRILDAGEQQMSRWAILAQSSSSPGCGGRLEPCIGLYRKPCAALARTALAEGRRSLHDLIPPEHLATVEIAPAECTNINTHAAMLEHCGLAGAASRPASANSDRTAQ